METHSVFFAYAEAHHRAFNRDGTWHVDYFPWGQELWGKGNLSVYRTENYKLYNELCNLSKYCYAMKLRLTKQNYTKYTKKVRKT